VAIKRGLCKSNSAALESITLTAVIDAHEERNVMTCDIPNAFIQALMPEVKDGDERVMMKITRVLVDMLVEFNPELYGPYVVYERNRRNKVLYVQVMRAIYGMLEAAILYYGTRSSEENPDKKDSSSILMIHVLQTVQRKDRIIHFFSTWMI
jgi:hypothetical protein